MTFPIGTPLGAAPAGQSGTVWAVDGFVGYEGLRPVPDDLGCLWFVTNVDGWHGQPPPRVDSEDRPEVDGTLDGPSTQPGRTITIEGTVRAPDLVTLHRVMDRADSLLLARDRYATLWAQEAHLTRHLEVRRGAEAIVKPSRTAQREATFSWVLYAPDGRRLGDPLTASTFLPSSSGGLQVPFTVPFTINASMVSGACFLNNPGGRIGPVMLRIDGPVVGPFVTHQPSGLTVALADLTLLAGEWVEIDMERHEALANGQAPRPLSQRGWSGFDLDDNEWQFGAATYNPTAKLTVTATPAS